MNPKYLSENENLLAMMDKMIQENPGTNFDRCFPQHFAVFHKYVDSAKKKQMGCFPDRDTYEAFSSAKLFFDKFKYVVFQKDEETQDSENEDAMPPLDAFYHTEDEIEMKKNRILEDIKKGDILHLKVVEENEEQYKLQILNKYGDKQRIIDCSLFAVMFKGNRVVQDIKPPLRIDDLIRAIAFGNVKQEKGVYKKLIVTLNANAIADNKLQSLHLGRVYKKDIPYYPEDVSEFKSFGEYLKGKNKFRSPDSIQKQIRSFGCDPLKTGPLYETRYKKQIPNDCDDSLSDAAQRLTITCDKTRKAAELLKKGEFLNALLEVQEALDAFPTNDLALTIRGKIYLALAGGKPSPRVKKAFLDFEAALRINCFNEEAKEFREVIARESWESFTKKNMQEKADKIKAHLTNRSFSASTVEFLENIQKRKVTPKKTISSDKTGELSSRPIPFKDEPMDV